MSTCRVPKTSLVDGIRCDVCEAKTPLTDSAGWMQVGTMDLCGPCGSEVVKAAKDAVSKKPTVRSMRDILDGLKPYPPPDLMGLPTGLGAYRPHEPTCPFLRGEFCNCP